MTIIMFCYDFDYDRDENYDDFYDVSPNFDDNIISSSLDSIVPLRAAMFLMTLMMFFMILMTI